MIWGYPYFKKSSYGQREVANQNGNVTKRYITDKNETKSTIELIALVEPTIMMISLQNKRDFASFKHVVSISRWAFITFIFCMLIYPGQTFLNVAGYLR